jgi:putative ATP-dependent endonuclease of OLD family
MYLLDSTLLAELHENGNLKLVSIDPNLHDRVRPNVIDRYHEKLAAAVGNPFRETLFWRLSAERDIRPEAQAAELKIDSNGGGLTSTVAQIINCINHPSHLVEREMLRTLNSIFEPDAKFIQILVQQLDTGAWEILLDEEGKGRIALSHSGSGLKTILLVIACLELAPYIAKTEDLSRFIFAFEELENNLHPALQRRLLNYVRTKAVESHIPVFITTHSSAVIDLFHTNLETQIVHVTHDGKSARARSVATYVDNHGVLDDLDVRASDLLQANGIVWIEGPSDRLYFNRWIDVFTEGRLKEGTHYQCVFYGGRLLAHLSAEAPDPQVAEAIRILNVNRNMIVIMDSDKASRQARVGETKKRILREVSDQGGLAWITKGREVENYLPLDAFQSVFPKVKQPLGEFEDIADYLERVVRKGEGKRFERGKAVYAERFIPGIHRVAISTQLDLEERLKTCVERIDRWNGMRER